MTELYQAWLEGQAFQQFMLLFWMLILPGMFLIAAWLDEGRDK